MSKKMIILILFAGIILFMGCGSTQETTTATASPPVILDGRILYPDGDVVEDQIINVKLDPGPDTLRVGSGYFNIGVMYEGRYDLLLLPGHRRFTTAPTSIVLERGLNMLDFTMPRYSDAMVPDAGVEQDTTVVPAVRSRLEPVN